MTNISQKKTDSDAFNNAEKQLSRTISKLRNSSSTDFLYGFLTTSERIMLTKRFGAIFLLHHAYSPYRVAKLLGVSQPTIHRYQEQYQEGVYDSILTTITKQEERAFLKFLSDFAFSRVDYGARKRLRKRLSS